MQQTLKKQISLRGTGLHSGADVLLTLKPAAAGRGIVFIRTDVSDRDNAIPALWNRVVDTRLCTMIGNEAGVTVGTIEHLMSALRGCGIDNLIIELDGPEVPVMDGSSAPFVAAIDEVGVQAQGRARRAIKILKTVTVEEGDKFVSLSPDDTSHFAGQIEFSHPAIGAQTHEVTLMNGNFRHDIAEARTFGFLHEVEALRRSGLALGGSLENAIVLDQDSVMNPGGLRYSDEFIRHKLLDAIGDLYLAGAPIIGAYDSRRCSHALNNALLHKLFATDGAWAFVEMADEAGFDTLLTAGFQPAAVSA